MLKPVAEDSRKMDNNPVSTAQAGNKIKTTG
jgi:hypothetical protein